MTHLAPPSGDLRTRTWASVGGPILGLVAAMACVAFILLWRFADHQDQAYVDTTTRLLENAVAAHEQTAANVATDYAMWNDAYEHITTRWDPEWIDRNYYSSIADGVMIVRADGAVRRTWIEQTQAVNRVALQAGVVRAVRTRLNLGALLSSAPGAATTASSVFVVDGQPVLLSVSPITPDQAAARDPDLAVDYVAAFEVLTAEELAAMGEALQIEGLHFAARASQTTTDQVSLAFPGVPAGERSGALIWTRVRPGADALTGEIGLTALLLLIIGGLTTAVASRLVSQNMRVFANAASAEEASRVKSEFIATMSHELRTPLNAIVGYTEMIEEDAEEIGLQGQTIKQDARRVLEATGHLGRLINDILDQSRIDSGKVSVTIEPVSVAAICSELEELMSPLAHANANTLSVIVDEDVSAALADPMRLQQCLVNLTGNALKFTRNGEVSVRARRMVDHVGERIVFEVQDNGIGIEKAAMERLFKPFSQASNDVTLRFGGTGLGLSITRSMARAMGGDVFAESTYGVGSLFSLVLSAADTDVAPAIVPLKQRTAA